MSRFFLNFLMLVRIGYLFNSDFVLIGIVITVFSIFVLFILIRISIPLMIPFYKKEFFALVITKSENYIIVFDGFHKIYVNTNNTSLDFLDLVKFSGNFGELNFHHLESSFDFEKYLINSGVRKQFYYTSFDKIIDFPFNVFSFRINYLNNFKNNDVKSFIGGILFSFTGNDNSKIESLKFLNYTVLLSITGVYLNYFIKKISHILSFFFNDKVSNLIAIILIFPLLFLNIDKFTTYKVFLFFVIRFVNKYYLKEKLSKIERISLIGILLIIFDPFIIFQESFILSFIISVFLNFSYLFKRRFKRLKLWLIDIVIVSLLLIPFNINDTYSFNIIRIISNLLISQIMRPLFIFFYLLIFVLRLNFLNGLIETIMNFLSRANFDFFNLNMPQISPFFMFIYYLLLSVVFYFYEFNFKKIGNSILLFLLLSIAVYSIPISNIFTFEVSYINVGQGDSTLIRYEGETILLDTGGLLYSDVATDSLIPYLRSKRIYNIDKIIITHDDYDHCGALDSMVKHYPIKAVYRNNSSFPLKIKDDFLINNLNVFNFQNDDNNYKSLVLNFKLKEINFLIMGDAPIEVEKMIVAKFPDLKCDI